MSTKSVYIKYHLKQDENKADESDVAARYRYYSYRLGKQNDSGRDGFIFAEPELYSTTRLQTTVIQSKWDSRLVPVLLALKFHSDSGPPIRDSIFFLLPARLDEFSTRFNLTGCPWTLVHTTWMSARTRMYRLVNIEDGCRIARKFVGYFEINFLLQNYTRCSIFISPNWCIL